VAVDIPGKTVRVQYDEREVTIARITRAIEEEDYPVASVR
jgi:copper chaperone CopZ